MAKYILVINSLNVGGAERIATLLAGNLVKTDEVRVIVLDNPAVGYHLDPKVKLTVLPFGRFFRLFFPVFFFFQALLLVNVIAKNYPEKSVKCICFLHRAGIVTALACLVLGMDFLYSERSVFSKSYSKLKAAFLKPLLWFTLIRAKEILAISNVAKQEVKKLSKRNAVVIHNPVDTNIFSPRNALREKGNRIVCVGRLVKLKRFDFAIRLLEFVNRGRIDKFSLDLVGDGPVKQELVDLARVLQVSKYVNFHGFVSDPAAILSKGKVCLVCSEYESFGNVAVEALACGLPVLYPEHLDSLNEVLDNTVSARFNSYDLDDANTALNHLLNGLLEYSDNAHKLAESFSADLIFEKYKTLIG